MSDYVWAPVGWCETVERRHPDPANATCENCPKLPDPGLCYSCQIRRAYHAFWSGPMNRRKAEV